MLAVVDECIRGRTLHDVRMSTYAKIRANLLRRDYVQFIHISPSRGEYHTQRFIFITMPEKHKEKMSIGTFQQRFLDSSIAFLPLIPPASLLFHRLSLWWTKEPHSKQELVLSMVRPDGWSIENQLLAYVSLAIIGFAATNHLIPNIKAYTLRKGLSGKDLGKRGTKTENNDIPEALGIVPGAIFLICLIFCLVGYAATNPSKLLDCTSALLSICFMLFLGFTDDVLDWPWRYKLFLPTVASLPLLCCYKGSTSILVPIQLRSLIMKEGELAMFGRLLSYIVTIDQQSDGAIINLGLIYLLYMGMLAVFCTNAINIYAGINGLEAGQSYVIGCAVLLHNLWEIIQDPRASSTSMIENHLFSAMLMFSFVGVTLGLLCHNWYPATVFVGDTYCYFAGMTFAVVGILGHFSKTLLLFFIPQTINFLWSCPQLFKFVPCPRHRLPRFDASTGLMYPSTFSCKQNEYLWLKGYNNRDGTEVANMTVINLALQLFGPMTERTLCLVLLLFQVLCCGIGLFFRYEVSHFFFEE